MEYSTAFFIINGGIIIMRAGTTPSMTFRIKNELDLSKMTQIWITFKDRKTLINKTIEDITIDNENHKITTTLTQEDTLSFVDDIAAVQVRMLDSDGKAYASPIGKVSITGALKPEVIS